MNNKRKWQCEFDLAGKILGGGVTWTDKPHQVFRYDGDDVALIFYPHRTSAGNYHIRVRDQNSKNKRLARELLIKLDNESGFNCTFHCKSLPPTT